jgi:hypothetical protein
MNDRKVEVGKSLIQFLKEQLKQKTRKFEMSPCQHFLSWADGFWDLSK